MARIVTLDRVRTEEVIDDAVCRIADWVVEQTASGVVNTKATPEPDSRAHVILAAEGVRDEKRFASIER